MPVTCLVSFFAAPVSLFGVILGHLAMGEIGRSRGAIGGKGLAITGLIFSYLSLFLQVVMVFFLAMLLGGPSRRDSSTEPTMRSNPGSFVHADVEIMSGTFSGNNEKARQMAEIFRDFMQLQRDLMFTNNGKTAFGSSEEFVVHVHCKDDSVVFLAQVPSYRKFDDEAKKIMAELAWATAQKVTRDQYPPGTRLGVGLKGAFLYGSVQVGEVGAEDPKRKGTDKEALEDFFEPFAPEVVEKAPSSGAKKRAKGKTKTKVQSIDTSHVPRKPTFDLVHV